MRPACPSRGYAQAHIYRDGVCLYCQGRIEAWRVFMGGKDTGVVETDYFWAWGYWKQRALVRKQPVELRPV